MKRQVASQSPRRRVDFDRPTKDRIVERAGYRCEVRVLPECRAIDGGQQWYGYSIHHRRPRSRGGWGTASNGLLVCGNGTLGCHGWIEHHPAEARPKGWLIESRGDPTVRAVLLWDGRLVLLPDDRAEYDEVFDIDGQPAVIA